MNQPTNQRYDEAMRQVLQAAENLLAAAPDALAAIDCAARRERRKNRMLIVALIVAWGLAFCALVCLVVAA